MIQILCQMVLLHEVSSIINESITGDKDGTQDIGSVKNSEGKVTQENVPKSVVNDLDDGTWTKTKQKIYQSIDQSKLVPLLVKALQEAVTKIETLETSNADLITRVKTLEDAQINKDKGKLWEGDIANLIGGATPDIILDSDGAILNLQTSDTTVTQDSVLGAINFQAPDEDDGTDAILVVKDRSNRRGNIFCIK